MSGSGADLTRDTLVAGRYRVLERLGAGGMGVVHRARDTRLKRDVALKRVLIREPDSDEAAEARRRILREAEIAARVHHPRIVSIFDVLDDPGGPLLVLEYLPSRSLDELVDAAGVLTSGATARAGAQIAEGLAAAHAAGIVHRDVKPGNVLVGPGDPLGPVKLTDFGISQLPDTTTLTVGAIGTPPYFAPEIARGERATAASDVYALGATLRVAAQGTPPFGWGNGNPLELIRRIGQDPVPDPTVGGPLGELLARMTAADRDRRPTAAQAATLLWALADRPEPLHPVEPAGPGTDPVRGGSTPAPPVPHATTHVPSGRRRPWYRRGSTVAGTALLAAAAVTAAVLVATNDDGSAQPAFPAAIPALTIGDERTADPCSFVQPESLRQYGAVAVHPDYGRFSSCSIQVVPPGTAPARTDEDAIDMSVELHPSSDPMPEGTPEQIGDATVFRKPEEPGGCHRYIGLADQTYLDVSASYTAAGRPLPDTCTIAEVATASAATTLAGRGIGRRAPPSGPLWSSDACALLAPGDLTFLPPGQRTAGSRGFAGWKCDWDDGTDDGPHVTLEFDRYDTPSEVGTPVPGTPVYVRPGDGRQCATEVGERDYTGSNGRQLAELLRIEAQGPGSTRELCDRAVALANAARARL